MSTPWILLRNDVLIADLATSDIDMESLQTEGMGITFASPGKHIQNIAGVGHAKEWEFVVYTYNDAGVTKPGTLTAQVIEKSPAPWDELLSMYVGAQPEVAIPTGRGFTIPSATFHEITVRCSVVVAADATKLRVLYRALK